MNRYSVFALFMCKMQMNANKGFVI